MPAVHVRPMWILFVGHYLFEMRYLIVACLLVCCADIRGQESAAFAGKLVDEITGEPVPFATIRLKSRMVGVVSNSDGQFQIPARLRAEGDTLLISCIGYVTRSVAFSSFREGITTIRLAQAVVQLDQLTITARGNRRKDRQGLSAYRIVRTAIQRIPDNYPDRPFMYVGYYRDYQLRQNDYINLNEAIVEVHDGGFRTDDQTQTRISLIQYKENTDFPRDSATTVPYDNKPATFYKDKNKYIPNAVLSPLGGNELGILRLHDAIRNNNVMSYSYVNVFNRNFTENHSFRLEDRILLDSVALYCISFESNYSASGPRNFATGKIYIGVTDFAIHKLEYRGYNKTMQELQLMYEIIVEYGKRGSSMYLNYISFSNFFKTQNEREFKVIDISFVDQRNAFLLKFNSEPERTSVLDVRNYDFSIEDKPIKIDRIEIVDKTNALVFVEAGTGGSLSLTLANSPSKLKFRITNVRDIANRELDKILNTTLYQFRELFVQKLDVDPSGARPAIYIDRVGPLRMNPVSQVSEGNQGYWMNTPLKKN